MLRTNCLVQRLKTQSFDYCGRTSSRSLRNTLEMSGGNIPFAPDALRLPSRGTDAAFPLIRAGPGEPECSDLSTRLPSIQQARPEVWERRALRVFPPSAHAHTHAHEHSCNTTVAVYAYTRIMDDATVCSDYALVTRWR